MGANALDESEARELYDTICVPQRKIAGSERRGSSLKVAGDWLLIGPEGTGTIDVRAALRAPKMARNRIQAVGKGTINVDLSIDYEWCEVR